MKQIHGQLVMFVYFVYINMCIIHVLISVHCKFNAHILYFSEKNSVLVKNRCCDWERRCDVVPSKKMHESEQRLAETMTIQTISSKNAHRPRKDLSQGSHAKSFYKTHATHSYSHQHLLFKSNERIFFT